MEDVLNRKIAELNEVSKQLYAVLKDLEWREKDVAGEIQTLKRLTSSKRQSDREQVGSQRVVVKVLSEVLQDKRRLAKELAQRYRELSEEVKKLSGKTLEELSSSGEETIS